MHTLYTLGPDMSWDIAEKHCKTTNEIPSAGAPGQLQVVEDVNHGTLTFPELAAVALYQNQEKQHDGAVPAAVQARLKQGSKSRLLPM